MSYDDNGLWRTSVWPGHADVLLSALDPGAGFVLIETWDGIPGWHDALVTIGAAQEPRTRLVRHHRFDLLVTPTEAIEIGQQLRSQGIAGGGLGCYQFPERPRPDFRLPEDARARADAMRGQGVVLRIDLPHDGEVAVAWSPMKEQLERFARMLT